MKYVSNYILHEQKRNVTLKESYDVVPRHGKITDGMMRPRWKSITRWKQLEEEMVRLDADPTGSRSAANTGLFAGL